MLTRSDRTHVTGSRGLSHRAPGGIHGQNLGNKVDYRLLSDTERLEMARISPERLGGVQSSPEPTGVDKTSPERLERDKTLISLNHPLLKKHGVSVTGGALDPRMGSLSFYANCETCSQVMGQCPGHFGCIELAVPVLPCDGAHSGPLHQKLAKILKHVCLRACDDGFPCCERASTCKHIQVNEGVPKFRELRVTLGTLARTRGGDIKRESRGARGKTGPLNLTVEAINSRSAVMIGCKNTYTALEVRTFLQIIALLNLGTERDQMTMDLIKLVPAAEGEVVANHMARIDSALDRYMPSCNHIKAQVGKCCVTALCPQVLLVVPPVHRPDQPRIITKSLRTPGGCTLCYQAVIRANENLKGQIAKMASTRKTSGKKIPEEMLKEHRSLNNTLVRTVFELLQGQVTKTSTDEIAEKTDFAGLVDVLTGTNRGSGKDGLTRTIALGKRVSDNARAVILGSASMPYDCVGVPHAVMKRMTREVPIAAHMLLDASRQDLADMIRNAHMLRLNVHQTKFGGQRRWVGLGEMSASRFEKLIIRIAASSPGDFLIRRNLVNGDVVMLNRQPTLQRQNVLSARVMELPKSSGNHSCLLVNPEQAMSFNLDFDGDQMAVFVPRNAIEEMELAVLHAPAILAANANGKMVQHPGQTTCMAWYSLSELRHLRPDQLQTLSELLQETLRPKDMQLLGRVIEIGPHPDPNSLVRHVLSVCLPLKLNVEIQCQDAPMTDGDVSSGFFEATHMDSSETWKYFQDLYGASYVAMAISKEQVVLGGFIQFRNGAVPTNLSNTCPNLPETYTVTCAGRPVRREEKSVLRVVDGTVLEIPRITKSVLVGLVQAVYDYHGGAVALATMTCLQRVAQSANIYIGQECTSAPTDLMQAILKSDDMRIEMNEAVDEIATGLDIKSMLEKGQDALRHLPTTFVTLDGQLRHGQRGEEMGMILCKSEESAVLSMVSGGMATSVVSGAKGKVMEHLAWTAMGIGPIEANGARHLPGEDSGPLSSAGFAGSDTYSLGFLDFGRFVQSQELGCRGDMAGKVAVGDVGYLDRKQLLEHTGSVAGTSGEVLLLAGKSHTRVISPLYGGDGLDPHGSEVAPQSVEYGSPVGSWAIEALFADLSQEALDSKHGRHGSKSINDRIKQLLEPPQDRTIVLKIPVSNTLTGITLDNEKSVADLVIGYRMRAVKFHNSQNFHDHKTIWKAYEASSRDGQMLSVSRDDEESNDIGVLQDTPTKPDGLALRVDLNVHGIEASIVPNLVEQLRKLYRQSVTQHKAAGYTTRVATNDDTAGVYTIWILCDVNSANKSGEDLARRGLWNVDDVPAEERVAFVQELPNVKKTLLFRMAERLSNSWRKKSTQTLLQPLAIPMLSRLGDSSDNRVEVEYPSKGSERVLSRLMSTLSPEQRNELDLDDPLEACKYFGLEIGRMVMAKGLAEVRPHALPRHVGLVADTLTLDGNIRGVDKRSVKAVRTPLELMAFESVRTPIFEAAINNRSYFEDGVFTAAMFNRPAQVGTGLLSTGNGQEPIEPVNINLMGHVFRTQVETYKYTSKADDWQYMKTYCDLMSQ